MLNEIHLLLALPAFTFLLCCTVLNPNLFIFYIIIINVLAIDKYRRDKAISRNPRRWRIPEAELLLFGLLGGWIGAIFAQHYFNHKRNVIRKMSFQFWFLCSILLNAYIIYVNEEFLFS